jgi:hypothetical protein
MYINSHDKQELLSKCIGTHTTSRKVLSWHTERNLHAKHESYMKINNCLL